MLGDMYMNNLTAFEGTFGLLPMLGAFTLITALILTILALKGFSLWYAARAGQRNWFIALLVLNTFGILEVVYLIWFRPKSVELAKTTGTDASSVPVGN